MRRWVGTLAVVGPLIAVATIVACRQLIGIDQYFNATADAASDAAPSACGLPYGTNACASCVNANCCSESSACAADPLVCAPYEGCLGNCNGDPACRSRCTIDRPVPAESAVPVSPLSACLAAKCETACGVTCGGFAGYLSEPDAAAGCQSCIQKSACSHARACGASVDCDGLWRCVLACTTSDCRTACIASHDAGTSLVRDLYKDYSSICSTSCDYGGYWACAGTFHQWPAARSLTVNLTWWVYDFQTQAGVSGADVSICTGCPCPSPNTPVLVHGTTDPNGYFTLPVPQIVGPSGVASAFCVQATAPGYMTTFQYWVFPLSEPTLSIGNSLPPTVAVGLALLTVSAQMANESANGATYDPTRGLIGVGVFDCLSSPANDVFVTLDGGDEGTVVVGAVDAGPGALPTAQSGAGVSGVGRAIFFNVPPGTVTLTATPQALGKPVGRTNVNVTAGTLTQVYMPASPSP